MAGIGLMGAATSTPAKAAPSPPKERPDGQMDDSAHSIYAPRPSEIKLSDGIGLEQPQRSPVNPRLRGEMLTFAGQPSIKSNPSSSIPEIMPDKPEAEDILELDLVDDEVENEAFAEDDPPPWETFTMPRKIKTLWKFIRLTAYRMCVMQTQCTCAFVFFWFAAMGITIGAGLALMPMKVETSFDSFLKTDVEVSVIYDTWSVWKKLLVERNKNSPAYSRLLQDSTEVIKDIFLFYQLKQDDLRDGIGNEMCLHQIALFEQSLRALPKWQELCALADPEDKGLCDPGMSFAGYGLPTLITEPGNIIPTGLTLDGRGWDKGWEPLPMQTALLLAHRHDVQELFFPEDYESPLNQADDTGLEQHNTLTSIRSAFRFRAGGDDGKRLNDQWKSFCKDELIPILNHGIDSKMMYMYYDGTGFDNWEVLKAMWQDMSWAAGAVIFVFAYLVFHTRSIILSILGLFSALLSLPLSYMVCALLANTTTVSFAYALMIFLIIGFGCDMILVYTDFWRDSVHVKDKYVDRLVWTYRHGGSASLATTSVTALSFFANLASVIRALRQIGFFMGLCISIAWLLVTTIYVPLCLADERFWRRCRSRKAGRGNPGRSLREQALKNWGVHLWRFRWLYFIIPILSVVAGLIVAAIRLDFQFESPDLFPEDHHRYKGAQVASQFESSSVAFGKTFSRPGVNQPVCSTEVTENFVVTCVLMWCDASEKTVPTGANGSVQCDCVRRWKACTLVTVYDAATNTTSQQKPSTAVSHVRWVGLPPLSSIPVSKIEAATRSLVENGHSPSAAVQDASARCNQEAVPGQMVMQDWTSGHYDLESIHQCQSTSRRVDSELSPCSWEDRCYCGKLACQEDAVWSPLPRLDFSTVPGSRRLASNDNFEKVRVLFGVQIDSQFPLLGEMDPGKAWKFLDTFKAEQPWGQRNMNSLCADVTPDLAIDKQWCWVQPFREWLILNNERFPTRPYEFMPKLRVFLQLQTRMGYQSYMWLNDDNTEVLATYFSFNVRTPKKLTSETALNLMQAWDKYIAEFNAGANVYGQGAIVISKMWVEPKAQSELLSSSLATMIVLVVLAFVGMLLFTRSVMLSMGVVLVTLGVVGSLMFVIVVIAAWSVGLFEGVALIYFIGYAVTYALHIAHKYGTGGEVSRLFSVSDEELLRNERFTRTIHALTSIGGAALGSAATTAGASLFLCFCTLVIFRRLGAMCLAVTLCSIIFAFGPLPAALMICGPLRPGRGCGVHMARLWRLTYGCRQRLSAHLKTMKQSSIRSDPSDDLPPWSPSVRKSIDLASPSVSRTGDASPSRRSGDASPSRRVSGQSSPLASASPVQRVDGDVSPVRKMSNPEMARSPSRSSGGDSPMRASTGDYSQDHFDGFETPSVVYAMSPGPLRHSERSESREL